jgi:uncharacterized protein YijF (DUF1287 family)
MSDTCLRRPGFRIGGAALLAGIIALFSAGGGAASFGYLLATAALERTRHQVRYDPAYVEIAYPWGDVPADRGVCTDEVIRSYRALGIDLQRLVHLDMRSHFDLYPNLAKWELSAPDPNIDHRRVLNLMTFFARHGKALPVSKRPENYRPGDLVTWTVPPDLPHIGIVSNRRGADRRRYMIVHNIGRGPRLEDRLFDWPITGHYRFGEHDAARLTGVRQGGCGFGEDC